MNAWKYLTLLVMAAACLPACEIETDVKLRDAEQRIVIESWINDQDEPRIVRITRSTPFTGDPNPEYVSNALVVLSDAAGQQDTLPEIRPGYYETSTFSTQQEMDYTMTVVAEGKTYTASNRIRRINPILQTGYFYSDTIVFGVGYYVGIVAPEPPGVGDYYQFRIWRNDSLFNSPFDIIITNDQFVDGQVSPFMFPYPHELGDTVVVEIRSLTNLSYDFYLTLQQQTAGGGGPFGSPPENVVTNWDNNALGFFGTAAVTRDTVVIQ